MRLTAEHRRVAADLQKSLVARGLAPARAAAIVQRSVDRMATCCGSCRAGSRCASGLGATTVPTAPVAVAGAPGILADVAAAGDDPSVAAARNIVSKWSWLIPVGGLLMSAKNKISAWRSPASEAIVGARRRR